MYVVKGRLEPEAGAVLMRAVEAASDALFRREPGSGDARAPGDGRPKPKQRRADAVGLLAERALAAGFGGGDCRDSRSRSNAVPGGYMGEPDGARIAESDAASRGESDAVSRGESDADVAKGESKLRRRGTNRGARRATNRAVESGTRAERYQVMVHCDAATLAEEGEPGRSDLDGVRVSAETSPAHGVRRGSGRHGAREGRVSAERGPQDAHNPAAHPAGAGGARPGVPLSRGVPVVLRRRTM